MLGLAPDRAPRVATACLSEAIVELFPAGVVAAEVRGTVDVGSLSNEEVRCCEDFGPKRVADFAAGRACARRVLETLGHRGFSLVAGADRRPCWPRDIVGSISHTSGFCGAVAAPTTGFLSIGFDAELLDRVGEELWPTVFTPLELQNLVTLSATLRPRVAAILFSAKESFYKCQFGVTASWLDFTDVSVTLEHNDARAGTFAIARTRPDGREPARYEGRFRVAGDVVLTGVAFASDDGVSCDRF